MKNFLSTLFHTAVATGVLAVPLSPNALDSRSLAAKTAYTVDAYGKEIAAADAVEVLGRSLAAKTAYTVDAYGKEIAAADAAEVLGSKKS
jgi:hypothetical protein